MIDVGLDTESMEPKRILVIATGGTIGSGHSTRGVTTKEGLIEKIIERARNESRMKLGNVSIDIRQVLNEDSTNMDPEKQRIIAREAFEGIQKYDAVVITHGTDTLQYFSATLSLMLHTNKPVIITGAMKNPEDRHTDAVRNLGQSIIAARTFAEKGVSGVFVLFNGKVMPGEWTYEGNPYKIDAFRSIRGNVGTIGKDGSFIFRNGNEAEYTAAGRRVEIPKLDTRLDDRIGSVTIKPNTDKELLIHQLRTAANRSSALLVEVYPSVGFPEYLIEPIRQITSKKVIVATPNTPGGKGGIYQVSFENVTNAGALRGVDFEPLDNAILRYALGHVQDQNDILEIKKSVLLTQARIRDGNFYKPIDFFSEDEKTRLDAIARLSRSSEGQRFMSMELSRRDLKEAQRGGFLSWLGIHGSLGVGGQQKNKDKERT